MLKPTLEVLAGIPSVVLGFFALSVIAPSIVQRFTSAGLFSLMSAGIAVGILSVPLVASVSEDALRSVPLALREASYGMGAKKITTVTKVVVPAAVSGLVAAFILAVSRAIGETMVVFIAAGAAGNQPFELSPLEAGPHHDGGHGHRGPGHRPGEGRGPHVPEPLLRGRAAVRDHAAPQLRRRPLRAQGPAGLLMATTIGVGAEYARGSVRDQLTGGKRDHSGRIFQLLLWLSLGFSLGVLAILFYDVFVEGVGVFSDRAESFLSGGLRSNAAASGVFQAIKGTFWIGVFVVVLSFPIGVASAVYLEEYATKGRFARLIDVNIRNLAGVPSIVYGILGLALFVQSMEAFTGGRTLMAAGITLAILVLPIVIITVAEAVRAVPSSLREAALRRRAPPGRRSIRTQVLPYALPGIITGTVLALARAIGEAAPALPGAAPSPGCSPARRACSTRASSRSGSPPCPS